MNTATAFQVIDVADLPEYPVDVEASMAGHFFTTFYHDRWLNSELHLTASLDVQACALNLFFLAQKQTPVGTLPDNDAILARLLRVDLQLWKDLRARTVGPLHKWQRCRCGDEIRLMHPVVTEVVLQALGRREAREASNAEKAVYQRLQRLRSAMHDMGMSRDVIRDDRLIERIDAWMLENVKGQRRRPAYDAAILHASRMKWLGGLENAR